LRQVGSRTDDVFRAFGRRKSSTGNGDCWGGGGVSNGCRGRGVWLFFRCSGVEGRDDGAEEGARVGEDVSETSDEGSAAGSNSRSGIGGETIGRLVIRRIINRKTALQYWPDLMCNELGMQ